MMVMYCFVLFHLVDMIICIILIDLYFKQRELLVYLVNILASP